MRIDKERTGCGLSVRTSLTASELKDKMNLAAEAMHHIFVPSEVIWEGERYKFYISHRQSLKEYIYENGFEARDFFALMRRLCELFSEAYRGGISPHEFVFNYECIFVGASVYDLEFIYAPDADTYNDGRIVYNKCSDMAAIASLHIEYTSSEQSRKAETAVSDILRLLSEWESSLQAEGNIFPFESIMCILDKQNSLSNIERILHAVSVFIHRGVCIAIEYVRTVFEKEVFNMRLNGGMLLNGIRYTACDESNKIRIGRDSEWADVPLGLIFISRRHAELYRQNEDWFIKDLSSTNGTYVNGTKLIPESPVRLQNGSRICLGIQESELIFRLP